MPILINLSTRVGLMGGFGKKIGKLFGDKGYISKELQESLWDKGIQLITGANTIKLIEKMGNNEV